MKTNLEPSLRFLSHFVTLDFYLILMLCLKHHNGKPLKYFKQGNGNFKDFTDFLHGILRTGERVMSNGGQRAADANTEVLGKT